MPVQEMHAPQSAVIQLAQSMQEQAAKLTEPEKNEVARQMQQAAQGAQSGQAQLSQQALQRLLDHRAIAIQRQNLFRSRFAASWPEARPASACQDHRGKLRSQTQFFRTHLSRSHGECALSRMKSFSSRVSTIGVDYTSPAKYSRIRLTPSSTTSCETA